MDYFEFLASYSRVETIIGLISFMIASVLGYFAYYNTIRVKQIAEIIKVADTQGKVDLATALSGVLPGYKIPELNPKDGPQIIKLQLEQREKEFKSRVSLLKLGMALLFSLFVILITKSLVQFNIQSPKVDGNDATIIYKNNYK